MCHLFLLSPSTIIRDVTILHHATYRRCAYLTRAQPIGPRLLIHSALSRLNDSVTTVSSPQRPASRPGDLLDQHPSDPHIPPP